MKTLKVSDKIKEALDINPSNEILLEEEKKEVNNNDNGSVSGGGEEEDMVGSRRAS